jgi:tetratricopeptide (TPR) repeat protein
LISGWIMKYLIEIIFLVFFSVSISGQNSMQELTSESQYFYNNGDYSAALQKAESCLKQYPNCFEAWILKADSKQKSEKILESITAYNQAEKINDKSPFLYINRGSAHITNNDLDKALEDINLAIQLDPSIPEAYYYRGNINYFNFKIAEAVKDYNKAIDLKPDYMAAYYIRAAAKGEQNKYDEAISDYQSALNLKPDLIEAKMNIAVLNFQNEIYDLALKNFNEIDSSQIKNKADYYFFRAETKYYLKDKNGACEDYRKASKEGDTEASEMYDKTCLKGEKKQKASSKRTQTYTF